VFEAIAYNVLLSKSKTVSEANGLLSCSMRTPKFMFLLQFWRKVLDSVNKLSEYLQNSSIDLITAESLSNVAIQWNTRNEEWCHF